MKEKKNEQIPFLNSSDDRFGFIMDIFIPEVRSYFNFWCSIHFV